MGFPTCWCAGLVPDAVARRAAQAWRSEVAGTLGAARDDTGLGRETAYVAVAWMLRSMGDLDGVLQEDRRWGIASERGRLLHSLDAAANLAETAQVLPGLRTLAREWRRNLTERWPETAPLGLYPAFARDAHGDPVRA